MDENIEQYFIPDTVSVGLFSYNSDGCDCDFIGTACYQYGFVTCKFKYDSWVSPGIFERLTKYKPSVQRDAVIQIEKSIAGAVNTIQNEPVTGFKLVKWGVNPYEFQTKEYQYYGDVILEDPRGFLIALNADRFFNVLRLSGGNIENNVLKGSFAYGWSIDRKRLTLIPAEYPMYQEWKTASAAYKVKNSACSAYISKKDLKPGCVYHAVKILEGDWMYVGVYDTYSEQCHLNAFDNNGQYDIDYYVQRESDALRTGYPACPTMRKKLIFYSMRADCRQYVVRTDIARIFDQKIEPDANGVYLDKDGKPYVMYYDNTKYVTFQNVLDDVSVNPMFNMIDFNENPEIKQLPRCSFDASINTCNFREYRMFPFNYNNYSSVYASGDDNYIKISVCSTDIITGVNSYKITTFNKYKGILRYTSCGVLPSFADYKYVSGVSQDMLYSQISPRYPAYTFKNGNPVRPEHTLIFIKENIRHALGI